MTLSMIRRRNETEDLLLSITKISEKLIEQTHRKAEETLEFKLTKPIETFNFNPPISIEGSWIIGLTGLEVKKSIFIITDENNKFELYKFLDLKSGAVSYQKIRDKTEKDLQNCRYYNYRFTR